MELYSASFVNRMKIHQALKLGEDEMTLEGALINHISRDKMEKIEGNYRERVGNMRQKYWNMDNMDEFVSGEYKSSTWCNKGSCMKHMELLRRRL